MSKQTQSLTKKEQAPLALPEELQGDWGTEETHSEDVIIPRLLLMHGQSDFVQEGDCNIGDLARSTDRSVLASKSDTVELVPFMMFKTWVNEEFVSDGKTSKWEYRSVEPRTPANFNLQWEWEEEDGTKWRRNKTLNFYCLLKSDIDSGNPCFPILVRFSRTSHRAGSVMADHFAHCKMERVPPCINSFELGSKSEKKDHTYQVFTVKKSSRNDVPVIQECKKWFDMISKDRAAAESKFKDHEVEESEEVISSDVASGDEF